MIRRAIASKAVALVLVSTGCGLPAIHEVDALPGDAADAPIVDVQDGPVAGTLLVGYSDPQQSDAPQTNGDAIAYQFVANASGTVTTLHLFLASQNTCSNVIFGVYTDSNDHPAMLLARGALTGSPAPGWNAFAASTQGSITASVPYWIALLCPTSDAGTLHFMDNGTSPGVRPSEHDIDPSLTDLPSVWSTGTRHDLDGPVSAYVSN